MAGARRPPLFKGRYGASGISSSSPRPRVLKCDSPAVGRELAEFVAMSSGAPRFPCALQHVVLLRRHGIARNSELAPPIPTLGISNDPGPAVHHFATLRAAPHPGNGPTARTARRSAS